MGTAHGKQKLDLAEELVPMSARLLADRVDPNRSLPLPMELARMWSLMAWAGRSARPRSRSRRVAADFPLTALRAAASPRSTPRRLRSATSPYGESNTCRFHAGGRQASDRASHGRSSRGKDQTGHRTDLSVGTGRRGACRRRGPPCHRQDVAGDLMALNAAAQRYLAGQTRGRLATVGPDGTPRTSRLGRLQQRAGHHRHRRVQYGVLGEVWNRRYQPERGLRGR